MADKDIKISLQTTGADAAAKEVHKVEQATEDLVDAQREVGQDGGLSAPGRSARETKAANDEAARSFDNLTDKATATSVSFTGLDREMQGAAKTTRTFTAGATAAGKSSANASRSLLLFSQGFEDAQFGMRGVLNNIPGLIISLGGTAGLAGAISIAAVSLSLLVTKLGDGKTAAQEAAEEAEKLEEAIKKIGTETDKITREKIDAVTAAIRAQITAADELREGQESLRKAEAAASLAALDNAEKIRRARVEINRLLGIEIDEQGEIQARAEAEKARREQAAKQELALGAARVADLDAAATAESEAAQAFRAQRDAVKQQLEDARNLLAVRKAEVEVLKDQARLGTPQAQQKDRDARGGIPDEVLPLLPGLLGLQKLFGENTQAKQVAEGQLESGAPERAKAQSEAQVKALEEKLKEVEEAFGAATEASGDAVSAAGIAAQNFATAQRQLIETLQADNLTAEVGTAAAVGEQMAKDFKAAAGSITTSNERLEASRQEILRAAESGNAITRDEFPQLARDLQALLGGIQSGLAEMSGQADRGVIFMASLQRQIDQTNEKMTRLGRAQ